VEHCRKSTGNGEGSFFFERERVGESSLSVEGGSRSREKKGKSSKERRKEAAGCAEEFFRVTEEATTGLCSSSLFPGEGANQ
jgi:hypothetical protein